VGVEARRTAKYRRLSLSGCCCTMSPCIARTFLSGLFPSNAHAPNALAYKQVIATQTPAQPAPEGNNREISSRTKANMATTITAARESRITEVPSIVSECTFNFCCSRWLAKQAIALNNEIEVVRISACRGVGGSNPHAWQTAFASTWNRSRK